MNSLASCKGIAALTLLALSGCMSFDRTLASLFEGIAKSNLQGSDAQSTKTLHNAQNNPIR